MEPTNLLYICSDQHNRDVLGCYGNPVADTPHLDRLAARGTRFTAAYTNCPICVPARAALATGQYVHQTRHWDNAFPYAGRPPGWAHRLKEEGLRVDAVGKLHFRSAEDDLGFTNAIEPLNVVDGIGDLLSCVRDNPPRRDKRPGLYEAGGGDSTYLRYDRRNGENAVKWLKEHAEDEKPWTLFLSFVCPHPPYIAPPELYAIYAGRDLPIMPEHGPDTWPTHPAIARFRRFFSLDEPLPEEVWHKAVAAYYGVCTYLDQQIGLVLAALEANGLTDRTRIIYTSDHGESLGARGMSGKFTMYDESVAVPMIVAGPDVPAGKTVATPVSLIDSYPTVVDAVGLDLSVEEQLLPGDSLWRIAADADRERTIFSEYHALGTESAVYMLRNRRYKYVHYVDEAPQLFDMIGDPREETDLARSPRHTQVLDQMETELWQLLDPDATDARAKADQAAKIEEFGGRTAVLARGTFTNSPTPDDTAAFTRY